MTTAILSPAEYYALERSAGFKNEFFRGEVFTMAQGSVNHSLINANLAGSLRSALRVKNCDCSTFGSDLRLKIAQTGLRTYPDTSVICGPVEMDPEDDRGETALNPTVIIEVFSDGTECYDRGTKFDHYQTIETLKQYVLVAQDEPRIETFLRQAGHVWEYVAFQGMAAVANLKSLNVSLPLAEIYRGVTFPPAPPLSLFAGA